MTSSASGFRSQGGDESREELGRGVCRDEGNCHGVRSRAFLGVWPVDGEEGCPIPNSQRTFSPSLAFSPRLLWKSPPESPDGGKVFPLLEVSGSPGHGRGWREAALT